ncbi:hypothetical protein SAY87_027653 [Trapa incisa]|uniref:Dolichyl-diphosphooligosaccharide--protein glycosyltransferase subunit 4A n=1 Tax=Trapa incisa TaxID=236973 RepID=A0AAN7JMT0_9MYRT|nr:hypothetical protein SAY87_027653 [Trapa incisa]
MDTDEETQASSDYNYILALQGYWGWLVDNEQAVHVRIVKVSDLITGPHQKAEKDTSLWCFPWPVTARSGPPFYFGSVPALHSGDSSKMINDEQLGLIANFLGMFIFVLVIAYHYVTADPKYEGN